MKRRKFLIAVGAGALVTAVAAGKFLTTSFEDSAEAIIKRELGFLNLDAAGVKAFVADFAKAKDRLYKLTVKGYSFLRIDANQSGKVHELVSSYLLSTDFFANKMDESRIIKYVGLYDPYIRPCSHPFTSPVSQQEII
ncbi:MAG TPA: hypothetical protein VFT90_03590 [Chryseosolibacter sp.]|nr:hypothetical protein [Chryseosolibacter sp.]